MRKCFGIVSIMFYVDWFLFGTFVSCQIVANTYWSNQTLLLTTNDLSRWFFKTVTNHASYDKLNLKREFTKVTKSSFKNRKIACFRMSVYYSTEFMFASFQ